MVPQHFQLREQPFGVTPDPKYLYASASHREALASLLYALQSGLGFVSLIAQPGMGKTTLLFEVLSRLRETRTTVFLFQTISTPVDLMRAILIDLGGKEVKEGLVDLQTQLNKILLTQCAARKPVVVIIDEAQNLSDSVLETVRMLSNFETASQKLMQIILAGQPQLAEKLMSAELLQLRQRISIFAHLTPLSMHETASYIHHRLKLAGLEAGTSIFTPSALASIARHSEGIPRNINNLCFNAMSLACALKCTKIDCEIVNEVISDLSVREHLLSAANCQFDPDESLPFPFLTEEDIASIESKAEPLAFNAGIEASFDAATIPSSAESRRPLGGELSVSPINSAEAEPLPALASIDVQPTVSANTPLDSVFQVNDHLTSKVFESVSTSKKDRSESQIKGYGVEQDSPIYTSHANEHALSHPDDLKSTFPSEERIAGDVMHFGKASFAGFESRSRWKLSPGSWNHTAIVATIAAAILCGWLGLIDYRIFFPEETVHSSSEATQPAFPVDNNQGADQAEDTRAIATHHRGSIRVRRTESLATLCDSIYGECTPELLRQILDLNPSILYPNRLQPGQTIALPLDSHNAKTER